MFQRYTTVSVTFSMLLDLANVFSSHFPISHKMEKQMFMFGAVKLKGFLVHGSLRGVFMQVLSKLNRPILYSLSPGTSVTPNMAKDVIGLVNMYRITGDDWDTWGDVSAHFDVARYFQ